MSHYEERLQHDLDEIRGLVAAVSAKIEAGVHQSVRSLLTVNRDLASETILADLEVNRTVRRIDELCHAFVARYLPSAGPLRFISSVLRVGIALERVGDYAVTISREAVQLSAEPPLAIARDVETMADQARRLLHQSTRAFQEGNAELARGTMGLADQFGSTFPRLFDDLVQAAEQGERPVTDLFALLVVMNRLERICDQSKNVCEDTVFAATGAVKAPKVYKILFVDKRNARKGLLAEAMASKAYPESCTYASAGWKPADAVDEDLVAYADRLGLELGGAPSKLEKVHEELSDFHVVVDLDGGLREKLTDLPFHTVLLRWHLDDEQDLDALRDELAVKIRELVESLRGEQAR